MLTEIVNNRESSLPLDIKRITHIHLDIRKILQKYILFLLELFSMTEVLNLCDQ